MFTVTVSDKAGNATEMDFNISVTTGTPNPVVTPQELLPVIGPLIPFGSEPPEFPRALVGGELKRIQTNTALISAGKLAYQTSAFGNNTTHYMTGLAMQRSIRETGRIDEGNPDVAAELSILADSAILWSDLLDPYKMTHSRGLAQMWWLYRSRPSGSRERLAADKARTLIHNCAAWYSYESWSEPPRLNNPDGKWAGGRNLGQMIQVLMLADWMGIPYVNGRAGTGALGSTLMPDGSKPKSWRDQIRRLYPLIRTLFDNVVTRWQGMHDTILLTDGSKMTGPKAQGPPVTWGDLRAHTTKPDSLDPALHGDPYCVLFFQSGLLAHELAECERNFGDTEAGDLCEAIVRAAIPHRRDDWRAFPYRSRPVGSGDGGTGGYYAAHDLEGFWVSPALHCMNRASDGGLFRQFALDCLDGLLVGNLAGFEAKQGHERHAINGGPSRPARLLL